MEGGRRILKGVIFQNKCHQFHDFIWLLHKELLNVKQKRQAR